LQCLTLALIKDHWFRADNKNKKRKKKKNRCLHLRRDLFFILYILIIYLFTVQFEYMRDAALMAPGCSVAYVIIWPVRGFEYNVPASRAQDDMVGRQGDVPCQRRWHIRGGDDSELKVGAGMGHKPRTCVSTCS
jgi:hypothetical protein